MAHALQNWYRINRVQVIFWGLFILSILALAAPFLRYGLGALGLIGLVPLLLFLDFSERYTSARQRTLFVGLIGFGSMLCVLFWSLQTMPERWAYIHGWSAVAGLYINYFLFAGLFSLNFVLFAVLYNWLKPGLYKKMSFIALPAMWVISEYLRSFLFSILSYGQGASIGAYWNWGTLGLGVSTTPLGFSGRVIGLYGLTALAFGLSLAVVWLIRRRNGRPLLLAAGFCLVLSLCGYAFYKPGTVSKTVAFVQTPPRFEDTPSQDRFLAQATAGAQGKQVDLLVLPEHANLYQKEAEPDFQRSIHNVLGQNGVIVTSRLTSNAVTATNRLQVYDNNLQPVYEHDKSFLIPIGEYMPYIHKMFLTLMQQKQALDLNREHLGVAKVNEPIPGVALKRIVLGPQVCSGAVTPSLFQRQVKQGAQVLTNSASISMFSQAPSYQEQTKQFAHFIALANARPYVQAAEGGHGSILNSAGKSVVMSDNFGYQFGVASVQLVGARTVYSLIGEWAVGLSAVIVVWYAAKNIRTNYGHLKKQKSSRKKK